MLQDLLNDLRLLNAGNDADRPAALLTLLYFNSEDALQALCPGHAVGLGFAVIFAFGGWVRAFSSAVANL